jgi:hypothetical protein
VEAQVADTASEADEGGVWALRHGHEARVAVAAVQRQWVR